jgi:hypothetical protein
MPKEMYSNILVQARRNTKVAKRFFSRLVKKFGEPRVAATDKLRSPFLAPYKGRRFLPVIRLHCRNDCLKKQHPRLATNDKLPGNAPEGLARNNDPTGSRQILDHL